MKNIILIILSAFVFFGSCTKDSSPLKNKEAEEQTLSERNGKIPSNDKIFTIITNPDDYTWEEIDQYYKTSIVSKEDFGYKENLKKLAIWTMVENFDLITEADKSTLEFYAKEMVDMTFVSKPGVLHQLLIAAADSDNLSWIREVSVETSLKSRMHIESNFENANEILTNTLNDFEALNGLNKLSIKETH